MTKKIENKKELLEIKHMRAKTKKLNWKIGK